MSDTALRKRYLRPLCLAIGVAWLGEVAILLAGRDGDTHMNIGTAQMGFTVKFPSFDNGEYAGMVFG